MISTVLSIRFSFVYTNIPPFKILGTFWAGKLTTSINKQ
nr:MAG TPA: hypothetical protein [Caudoviricetes sp.]